MTAPYAPGDPIAVAHTCAAHLTVTATVFTVERVRQMGNGTHRVETTRCDGTGMHVYVGADGREA